MNSLRMVISQDMKVSYPVDHSSDSFVACSNPDEHCQLGLSFPVTRMVGVQCWHFTDKENKAQLWLTVFLTITQLIVM